MSFVSPVLTFNIKFAIQQNPARCVKLFHQKRVVQVDYCLRNLYQTLAKYYFYVYVTR